MTHAQTSPNADTRSDRLSIRPIYLSDLKEVLRKGIADFNAQRSDVFFLALIYPLIGIVLARITVGHSVVPLLYPLVTGFALIGPIAAIQFYELSRLREQGFNPTWSDAFNVVRHCSIGSIVVLDTLLAAIFLAWLTAAWVIYELTIGGQAPPSIAAFARDVFATRSGWMLILLGNGIGLMFAVLVLSMSVVSFPLLLDQNVDALTAVQTSLRVVLVNPATMAVWGLIVAGALAIGFMLFLVGLAVVLPVLGHATWHLYRRVVVH